MYFQKLYAKNSVVMKEIGQNFSDFALDYFDEDRSDVLQLDQQDVNLSIESFLYNMNLILDEHPLLNGLISINLSSNLNPG